MSGRGDTAEVPYQVERHLASTERDRTHVSRARADRTYHSRRLRILLKSFAVLALIAVPAEPQSATSLAGNRRVTREFCIRQTGST